MKYVRTFNSFKSSNKVNEEFIGGLFKGLKNKLSLSFSKMFGSASKIDKLMEEYKKQITSAQSKKRVSLKALGDYFKSTKDIEERDSGKIQELRKNLDIADKNYNEQIKLIKEKFDIKFNEIIKGEKNPKVKNFIKLKKIEMQQELLINEMSLILSNGILKPDDIDDPEFQEIIKGLQDKTEASKKMAEEEKKALQIKEEKKDTFDIEKADELAERGQTYLWDNSPMKDYKFEKDDKIRFYSQSNKAATKATVLEDSSEEMVKVKTEAGNEIKINRGTIISSDKFKRIINI